LSIARGFERLPCDSCPPSIICNQDLGNAHDSIAHTLCYYEGSVERSVGIGRLTNWNTTKSEMCQRLLLDLYPPHPEPTSPASGLIDCSACGSRVSPRAISCPACGEPIAPSTHPIDRPASPRPSVFEDETKRMLVRWFWNGGWRGLIFFVIVLIILIAILGSR
jgi:hypothetical protein